MRRIPVLIASAAINASTIPAVAEHTSNKDIDASRKRWATVFQIFTASPLPRRSFRSRGGKQRHGVLDRTKRTLPYNIRPRHEFLSPRYYLREASKSASTDLHDRME